MSDQIRLIHSDCREILPTLAFDVIVSDPPYGITYQRGAGGRPVKGTNSGVNYRKSNPGPILGDDRFFDPSHLLRWPCVLFGANHYMDRLPLGGSWHVWDKRAHSSIDDSFSDVEFIWSSMPGKSRIISYLWKGVQQQGEKGKPRYHGSQKPISVMIQLISWFVESGKVICDPYAGSGSTGVACLKTGHQCILIEKDPKYLPIIRRRLDEASIPLFE
jgi:DNA modification methylase